LEVRDSKLGLFVQGNSYVGAQLKVTLFNNSPFDGYAAFRLDCHVLSKGGEYLWNAVVEGQQLGGSFGEILGLDPYETSGIDDYIGAEEAVDAAPDIAPEGYCIVYLTQIHRSNGDIIASPQPPMRLLTVDVNRVCEYPRPFEDEYCRPV
jgi:hypothetical protein